MYTICITLQSHVICYILFIYYVFIGSSSDNPLNLKNSLISPRSPDSTPRVTDIPLNEINTKTNPRPNYAPPTVPASLRTSRSNSNSSVQKNAMSMIAGTGTTSGGGSVGGTSPRLLSTSGEYQQQQQYQQQQSNLGGPPSTTTTPPHKNTSLRNTAPAGAASSPFISKNNSILSPRTAQSILANNASNCSPEMINNSNMDMFGSETYRDELSSPSPPAAYRNMAAYNNAQNPIIPNGYRNITPNRLVPANTSSSSSYHNNNSNNGNNHHHYNNHNHHLNSHAGLSHSLSYDYHTSNNDDDDYDDTFDRPRNISEPPRNVSMNGHKSLSSSSSYNQQPLRSTYAGKTTVSSLSASTQNKKRNSSKCVVM